LSSQKGAGMWSNFFGGRRGPGKAGGGDTESWATLSSTMKWIRWVVLGLRESPLDKAKNGD